MSNKLEIKLLGRFEVSQDGKPISITSRPAQSLFVYLILNAGTSYRREKLAGMLWPDSLEETARDNLRHALWRVRKALESASSIRFLHADDLSIGFEKSSDYWLDTAELEKLGENSSGDELMAALSEYQGELLPGFYDEWVVLEREHLQSIFEHHMARLMSLLQDEKRWLDLLDWGERWIKLGQKPEPAYRALMSVHAAKGDMSKVAATYERCVKSLREFGVEPSGETKELYERLKAGTLAPTRVINSNLPSGTVTFLFTDIEESTKLARDHSEIWESLRARHHQILREAIGLNNGFIFQIIGDAFCAAFHRAGDALNAAYLAQQDLQHEPWKESLIRVRMGIHTGEAEAKNNEYHGYLTISLVQRLMSAGHGGQVLVSETTENLVRDRLHHEIHLQDIGKYTVKDIPRAVRIFQMIAPGLQREFPPLRTLNILPHNLPIQLTSFIGRENEIAEIRELLANTRLVTLTGPGGTGKTRLSLQVAVEMLANFPDGVWLVELAPLSDAALIPQMVAYMWNLREQPGRSPVDTLIDYLRAKSLLLILDNCEHLITACAHLADILLTHCANLKILATSREALGITGERVYQVPTLPLPKPGGPMQPDVLIEYEGIQLFVERAVAVKSDFRLTEHNAAAVLQICQHLDGIPLAIELAAARTRMLTAEQIAERLNDRFYLLTQGSRTALPRQQTLRAAIDWSYELLTEPERILFRRLAVFASGFTLEAAEVVASGRDISKSQIVDLLGQLINKSLVTVEARSGNTEAETRYGMLETIRQYTREKLVEAGEDKQMRARHLNACLQFAEAVAPKLHGPDQALWLRRLESDHDNMRAALGWAMAQGDSAAALRLSGALGWFWFVRGPLSEGRQWLQQAIGLSLRSTNMAGMSADYRSRYAGAVEAAGLMADAQGDYVTLHSLYEESLVLYRELGDKAGSALSLHWLGNVAVYQGDYTTARMLHEESLALYRELEDKGGIGFSLNWLGIVASSQGDYAAARVFHEESLELFRDLGDKRNIAMSLSLLGVVAGYQGNHATARILHEESLVLFRELGDKKNIAEVLPGLAAVAEANRRPKRATKLLGAVESLLERIGARLDPIERGDFERTLAAARAQLDEAAFAKAWEEGRAMTMEQALEFALKETQA